MTNSTPPDTSPTDRTDAPPSHRERVRVIGQALAFRCTECGDCCRGWSVETDAAFRDGLAEQLSHHTPDETIGAYIQEPADDSVQREPVLQTTAGHCVFLGETNHCQLHEAYGQRAKPTACQVYPFRQVKLDGTSTVSLDLSCPAAAEMLAHTFPMEWIEYERRSPGNPSATADMIEGLPVGAPLLLELEETLLAILRHTRATLDERLLAASFLLDDALEDIDNDAVDGEGTPEVMIGVRLGRDEAIRDLVRRARAAQSEPLRHYLLMSRLIETIEQWIVAFDLPDGGTAWQTTRRLVHQFDLCSDTQRVHARAERLGDTLAEVWSTRSDAADDVMANYCWQTLGARHLTAEYGLVTGFRVLLVHVALVRLHAAGLAVAERAASIQPAHVIEAIRAVERNFAHLPLLKRFWKRTSVVNLLTQREFAARVLLLPEVDDAFAPGDHGEKAA